MVIDQIEGRDTPPTLTEVHERLLNHEVKLKTAVVASPVPVSANAVTYNGNKQSNNNRNQQRYGGSNKYNNNRNTTWQPQQNYSPRPDNRQSCGYQGKCQLCGIFGHSAQRCSQLQSFGSSSGQSNSFASWNRVRTLRLRLSTIQTIGSWIAAPLTT